MDARDFFAVAERLKSSALEADCRTLLNAVRQALASRGVIFGEVPEDHHTVIAYLSKSGNRTAATVGDALRDLRQDRNLADYNLATPLSSTNSIFACEKALRVMRQFDAIPAAEMDRMITTIQASP
jgi:hypothetical protein